MASSSRCKHAVRLRLMIVLGALCRPLRACTSLMVGPDATKDGSVWVAQSDDGEGAGDPRLVWVPAMDWPANSMRAVLDYENYPRYVGTERRVPAYYPSTRLPNATKNIIGHIPQVNHTFAYYEADYAIANEHGLAFGESTCSARTFAKSVAAGGPALLSMMELSRLAAERTASARDAVKLMGSLAERYGFLGTAPVVGGESLLVGDAQDQWIFHILAASNDKGGAIWAAQRIPRDHATIVANAFIIGEVDTDSEAFLYSSNMHSIAQANQWWDGRGRLHFTRTFSIGEYTSHAYSGRRMWAFWNVVAPSLNVPDNYADYRAAVGVTFPISAKPDTNVSREDLLRRVYRNYYDGTRYDLSSGPAAGPHGTPVRYKPGAGEASVAGACGVLGPCSHWERPIASFRSTNVHVTNVKSTTDAVLWFVPYAALPSVFIPAIVGSAQVPTALQDAHNTYLDRSKAFWVYKELAQFAYPRWNLVKERITAVAAQLEGTAEKLVESWIGQSPQGAADVLDAHANKTVQLWQHLYSELVIQYSDGFQYDTKRFDTTNVGYPNWWLNEVGYLNGTASPCKTATGTC